MAARKTKNDEVDEIKRRAMARFVFTVGDTGYEADRTTLQVLASPAFRYQVRGGVDGWEWTFRFMAAAFVRQDAQDALAALDDDAWTALDRDLLAHLNDVAGVGAGESNAS